MAGREPGVDKRFSPFAGRAGFACTLGAVARLGIRCARGLEFQLFETCSARLAFANAGAQAKPAPRPVR